MLSFAKEEPEKIFRVCVCGSINFSPFLAKIKFFFSQQKHGNN
jgi:hypothetical protein